MWFDFHPTGQPFIATAMTHNVVKVYDLKTYKLHQHYDCHKGSVNSVAFHPSGHFLITGSDDKTCKVTNFLIILISYFNECF
jgi:centriolar protein POC1